MTQDIAIINSYKALPLGDYLDIVDLIQDETLDDIDREIRIVSILTGKDEDFLLDLPVVEFKKLTLSLGFLQEGIPEINSRPAELFILGDYELVPTLDMSKVSTAQYIDFQEFHKRGMETHLPEILSCLLIPKGKGYCKDYDPRDVQVAIRREMSTFDALTLYGFFIVSCKESIRSMLTSSLQEIRRSPESPERERERTEEQLLAMLTLL